MSRVVFLKKTVVKAVGGEVWNFPSIDQSLSRIVAASFTGRGIVCPPHARKTNIQFNHACHHHGLRYFSCHALLQLPFTDKRSFSPHESPPNLSPQLPLPSLMWPVLSSVNPYAIFLTLQIIQKVFFLHLQVQVYQRTPFRHHFHTVSGQIYKDFVC